MIQKLTFDELAARYCEKQKQTPDGLLQILKEQRTRYSPDGWMLLEGQILGSSWLGSFVILPYGPNNTLKEIPTGPISPRGLVSDISVAVAYIAELPEVAAPWVSPLTRAAKALQAEYGDARNYTVGEVAGEVDSLIVYERIKTRKTGKPKKYEGYPVSYVQAWKGKPR